MAGKKALRTTYIKVLRLKVGFDHEDNAILSKKDQRALKKGMIAAKENHSFAYINAANDLFKQAGLPLPDLSKK